MKKMKLTRSLLAACSIVALTAVMYGCVHDGGDEEPMAEMPEPMPEPDPGPTDLDETQEAAAMAATAAMTASDNAEMSASEAEAATMHIATLQVGDEGTNLAKDAATAAREAADEAAAEAATAEAAAAATTGAAGEAAWAEARDARDAAQDAAEMAAEMAMKAVEAAMTELHIDGTVKSAGDSSVDAAMGMLTVTHDDGSKTITGHQSDVMREDSGAVVGRPPNSSINALCSLQSLSVAFRTTASATTATARNFRSERSNVFSGSSSNSSPSTSSGVTTTRRTRSSRCWLLNRYMKNLSPMRGPPDQHKRSAYSAKIKPRSSTATVPYSIRYSNRSVHVR